MFKHKSTYIYIFIIVFIVFFFIGYSLTLKQNKNSFAGYENGNIMQRTIKKVVNLLE